MSKIPCYVWDFTYPCEKMEREKFIKYLLGYCKKFTFQIEKGEETGYLHYQGRFSLIKKKRKNELIELIDKNFHISETVKKNIDEYFYILKEHTKVDGPWTEKDKPIYIPRQIREIKELYPWQKKIIEMSKIWDTRIINCIYDIKGNNGKSILCTYMGVYNLGKKIPFCNNYKDLMRIVMNMPKQRCYLMDMPRAINKDNLNQLYSGIETIKDGYAYDDRYHFKDEHFDCPNIFVFTNTLPDFKYLTRDRWKIWNIKDNDLKISNWIS